MVKKNKNQIFAALGFAASLGLNLAACIIVGVALGNYLDNYFDTKPYLTVGGILVGIFAGARVIYKKIMDFER